MIWKYFRFLPVSDVRSLRISGNNFLFRASNYLTKVLGSAFRFINFFAARLLCFCHNITIL